MNAAQRKIHKWAWLALAPLLLALLFAGPGRAPYSADSVGDENPAAAASPAATALGRLP